MLHLEPECSTLFAQLKFILVSPGKSPALETLPIITCNHDAGVRLGMTSSTTFSVIILNAKDIESTLLAGEVYSVSIMPHHPSFAFKCLKMMAFQGFQTQNKNLPDIAPTLKCYLKMLIHLKSIVIAHGLSL